MNSPVVFFDKDGTLVENIPYNVDPALIRLAPGVTEALLMLHNAGFRIAIVTNQSGVARGLYPEMALKDVELRIRELLGEHGVPLAGFFYCPHHPDGVIPEYSVQCVCRKPEPGLIIAAAESLAAELTNCWVVGDSLTDEEAGRRAGCKTALLLTNSHPGVLDAARRILMDAQVSK